MMAALCLPIQCSISAWTTAAIPFLIYQPLLRHPLTLITGVLPCSEERVPLCQWQLLLQFWFNGAIDKQSTDEQLCFIREFRCMFRLLLHRHKKISEDEWPSYTLWRPTSAVDTWSQYTQRSQIFLAYIMITQRDFHPLIYVVSRLSFLHRGNWHMRSWLFQVDLDNVISPGMNQWIFFPLILDYRLILGNRASWSRTHNVHPLQCPHSHRTIDIAYASCCTTMQLADNATDAEQQIERLLAYSQRQ